jgi:hypothetical protein
MERAADTTEPAPPAPAPEPEPLSLDLKTAPDKNAIPEKGTPES